MSMAFLSMSRCICSCWFSRRSEQFGRAESGSRGDVHGEAHVGRAFAYPAAGRLRITAQVTGDVAAVRLLTEQQPHRLLFERVWIRRSWALQRTSSCDRYNTL